MDGRRSILLMLVLAVANPAWGGDDTTLRVISVDPDPAPPYEPGNTPPESVVVTFNRPVLESSINGYSINGLSWPVTLSSSTQLTLTVDAYAAYFRDYLTLRGNIDDYNDYHAEVLALELSGQLSAPQALMDEIRDDLVAIRPLLIETTSISPCLDWVPGRLRLRLTPHGIGMYQSGTFYELYALNEIYGVSFMEFRDWDSKISLTFHTLYNPELLGPFYLIDGVAWTEPVGVWSCITDIAADPPHYNFEYGWGDCPAGCANQHFWEFVVNDGTAELVADHGDPLDDSFWAMVIASEDGKVLDGEYDGTFPSGNGTDGGDFKIRWGWCDLYLEGKNPMTLHFPDGPFRVVTGLLSDLRPAGQFDDATCLGVFDEGPVEVTVPDPPPGEAYYFLARASGPCAALGFGESSLPGNPRTALNGVCFAG
jgi:hypothetical protein